MVSFRLRELFPWRSFTIDTAWPVAEAVTQLREFLASPDAPFRQPRVFTPKSPTHFRFTRAIAYRNGFRPIIDVTLEPTDHEGARVLVRMRLPYFMGVFMAIWTAVTASISVPVALVSIFDATPAGILGFLIPLVGVALCGGSFAFEARRAEQLLRDIFPPPRPDALAPYR